MNRLSSLLCSIVVLTGLSGCGVAALGGGENRTSLARQTVQTYWRDIDHGKIDQAYNLLTPGNRQARTRQVYSSDILGFLQASGGVSATTGAVKVSDDTATVTVTLHSPKTSVPLHGYQHLFWQNGRWQISDQDGTITKKS